MLREVMFSSIYGGLKMEYIFLYIFLAIVCFGRASINKVGINNTVEIQKNANKLRGLFALFIVFTHCTLAYETLPVLLIPLRKVSTFGVGFFFVLSGYGLAYSYYTKSDYLKGFIYNKILKKIVVAAIICRIVSKILLVIFLDDTFAMTVSLFLEGINWYIYAMILLYAIFYIVYKYINGDNRKLITLWCIVIIITLMLLYVSNHYVIIDRSYFISEWAFPFGVTIYCKRDKIDFWINNHIWKISIVMLISLAVLFLGASIANEYTIADLVTHNMMLFPFYYFVMLLCRYFKFGNQMLNFLNSISFEIYLYQFAILIILKKNIHSIDVMYFVWVTVITIVLAFMVSLIHKIIKVLSEGIKKL